MFLFRVSYNSQSIYEFRGANSQYLKIFARNKKTASYELLENYRSKVFLSLSNYGNYLKGEEQRAIYVAPTRAKNNLFVHYSKNTLDGIHSDNVEYLTDNNKYGISHGSFEVKRRSSRHDIDSITLQAPVEIVSQTMRTLSDERVRRCFKISNSHIKRTCFAGRPLSGQYKAENACSKGVPVNFIR